MDPTQARLEDFRCSDAHRCVACGNCLYVCPVYRQLEDETFSARGRNQSIKESASGAVEPAGLSRCLLCGRCSAVCPQGVQHDKVVLASRADALARGGGAAGLSLVSRLLTHPAAFRRILRLAGRAQAVLPRSMDSGIPGDAPVIRYLPTLFSASRAPRRIPSIAARFLCDQVPELNPATASEKKPVRIVYFAGCATEYIYPNAGIRLIETLKALGVEVCVPKDLLCCGIPILAGGDAETAMQVARRNLEVLLRAKPDHVVTTCATCASTLRDVWPTLLEGAEKQQALEVSERVRDAAELIRLVNAYRLPRFKSLLPAGARVTYHQPCHSLRYPEASRYPVDLLKQVFGADYVDLDNMGCCGCGGSFNLHHYQLSRRLGQAKIESIRKTRADYVLTNCPGCMIQITDGLHRSGLYPKVLHLMEAIEPA